MISLHETQFITKVRYIKCFLKDLSNSLPSMFSHYIGADGCKNKGFGHFMAKKSTSNCLVWMKIRCLIPSSFEASFFWLIFPYQPLSINPSSHLLYLAESYVKMLWFKPNRRLLAQFVEEIYQNERKYVKEEMDRFLLLREAV